MYTNPRKFPGPGDEETWPPYSGHPNDPRAPAEDDEDDRLADIDDDCGCDDDYVCVRHRRGF